MTLKQVRNNLFDLYLIVIDQVNSGADEAWAEPKEKMEPIFPVSVKGANL